MNKPENYKHTDFTLFSTLEDLLYYLREGLKLLHEGDAGRIRTISSQLRDLSCKVSSHEGLLWRIRKIAPFDDAVMIPDFKEITKKSPSKAGGRVILPLLAHGEWNVGKTPLIERSLKKYFEEDEVMILENVTRTTRKITPSILIREVADQIGAHSTSEVRELFATLVTYQSGHVPMIVNLTASYAMLVAEVGERALKAAEDKGYKRRRLTIDLPRTSLEHQIMKFDLLVPSKEIPDFNNFLLSLTIGSLEEAMSGYVPIHISTAKKLPVVADIYVNYDYEIEVQVRGITDKMYWTTFKYPALTSMENSLYIEWDKKFVHFMFEGSRQSIEL